MGKGTFCIGNSEAVTTLNLLYAIQESWQNSDSFEAQDCAAKLSQILDEVTEEDLLLEPCDTIVKCGAPKKCHGYLQDCMDRSKSNKNLYQALIDAWDLIGSWKSPSQLCDGYSDHFICKTPKSRWGMIRDYIKDPFKDAMILGDKNLGALIESHELYIGIAYIQPGTIYPSHAHDATELYHTMVGNAYWGPGAKHVRQVGPDNFVFHPSAHPHYMDVPDDEPLIAIYAWTGQLPGCYWFGKERGRSVQDKYDEFYDVKSGSYVERFYDGMAQDYEEVVRHWGYNMPETAFTALVDHAELTKDKSCDILDLGCGAGLFGTVMRSRGFDNSTLTGLDISAKMLQQANQRNSYTSLVKGNLHDKLPFPENYYDYVVCIGPTTFLDPECLKDWLKVVKPGGRIVFANKTQICPFWEPTQDRLEAENLWKCVWKSHDLYHMPCNPKEDSNTRVKVMIYQKTFS